jgi:3-phenylpropionate/trans-cinnamate dioxygenase ferredoxin reductase subunit
MIPRSAYFEKPTAIGENDMSEQTTYVIIGAGLAGGRAAEAIRERDASGRIVLVGSEPFLPYHRPHLSKKYLMGKRPLEKVFFKPREFYDERKIEMLTGRTAVALAPQAHQVTLDDGTSLHYDRLLLATGAAPRQLDIAGGDLEGVHYLRTIPDSDALRAAMANSKKVAIVGGGFIGAEVASAFAQHNVETTMLLREDLLLRRAVGDVVARFLTDYFKQKGVDIRTDVNVDAFIGNSGQGRLEGVRLASGEVIPADTAAVGVGVAPRIALAQEAGLKVENNGVAVNEYLQSSDPDTYAAGDIAAFWSPLYHRRMRIEHWDVARQQGRTAGLNMAGANQPWDDLPYFYSDLFDLDIQAYGDLFEWDEALQRGPADPAGHPALTVFYLQKNQLRGALVINPAEGQLDAVQALLKPVPTLSEADRKRLSDPAQPLG